MATSFDNGPAGEHTRDSRPVSELVSDALQQFSRLVRKARQAARGGAMLGVAAAFALPSLFILMMALAAVLREVGLAASLSYLVTAIVGFAVSAVLVKVGLDRLKAEAFIPNRTINQLHRDAAAMKEHI